MKSCPTFFIWLLSCVPCMMLGQNASHQQLIRSLENNPEVSEIIISDVLSSPSYIALNTQSRITPVTEDPGAKIKQLYNFQQPTDITLEKTIQYLNGIEVQRYQAYCLGIKIEHGSYAALVKDGVLLSIHGEHYAMDNLTPLPRINESQALQSAVDNLGSDLYAWESIDQFIQNRTDLSPKVVAALQKVRDDEYPQGELVFVKDYSASTADLHLAYKFEIESVTPLFRDKVYVSATDGSILLRDPVIKHGIGETRYAGTRTMPTTDTGGGMYDLSGAEPVSGVFCETRSLQGLGGTPLSLAALYTLSSAIVDGDNPDDPCPGDGSLTIAETGDDNWRKNEHKKAPFQAATFPLVSCCDGTAYTPLPGPCNEAHNDDVALDAHWGASIVAQYWDVIHNRDSWDGEGADIFSFVHYGDGYDNAFWNGSFMTYGDGSYQGGGNPGGQFAPLTSMDVCAHEIGHAICTATSDLVYARESGALNEAFSDIWAAAIELYVLDSIDNSLPFDPYGIGEQVDERDGGVGPGMPGTSALRWMDDPKAASNPDTYGGTWWFDPECADANLATDFCGVHINSGVLNKWFYLMVEGSGQPFSSGIGKAAADDEINDNSEAYSVTSIGLSAAEQVTFLAETLLFPNAKFADMRAASIDAARALFGPCSPEHINVTNAWHAVGVGQVFGPCVPTIEFALFNPKTVLETGNEAGCAADTSLDLNMFSYQVNQTINFTTSGNAVPGEDYTLSESTMTFAGTEMKTLTIHIIDDKVVEGNDTVIVAFDDGGYSDADTVIIIDDDVVPALGGVNTLLSETFSANDIPAGWIQLLVNPESSSHWEFNGTGLAMGTAYAAIPGAPEPTYNQTADATVRLISPELDARGLTDVNISFDWGAGGETDAVDTNALFDYGTFQLSLDGQEWIDIEDYTGTQGGNTPRFGTYDQAHPELTNTSFYLGFRWHNDALVGSGFSFTIDNVVVSARALAVETELDASMSTSVPAATEIGFVSTQNTRVIGYIDLAQGDLGCTELRIDETSPDDIVGTGLCGLRSGKVFEITTLNTTDSFDLTLAFTDDEVSDWTAAEQLNILAVKSSDINDESNGIVIIPNSEIVVNDQLNGTPGFITYTFRTTADASTYALTDRDLVPVSRTVQNVSDAGTGSLRQRIAEACPLDTIRFDGGLIGQTIALTSGEIMLGKDLVIIGHGSGMLTVSGENNSRIFVVESGSNISLSGMRLEEAAAPTNGGAIYVQGTLTMEDIIFSNNMENGTLRSITNEGVTNVAGNVNLNQN